MNGTLRFGIIGCGVIGATHAEAITSLPGAQLVAVADIVPANAQQLANKYAARSYRGKARITVKIYHSALLFYVTEKEIPARELLVGISSFRMAF